MAALTYGQRSLLALLQRTHARDVAARCGVHASQVTRWMDGTSAPSERTARALEANYGISPRAWAVDWTARAK